MLPIHFIQQWFSVSDSAMGEPLQGTPLFSEVAGSDSRLPDETTILRFRRLLETNKLAEQMLCTVNVLLVDKGLLLKAGIAVGATVISAPRSTKNSTGTGDHDMNQTKKGNQWYFGMNAHIGVYAESGLVHTVSGAAANVHDVVKAHELLHGQESCVFADSCYRRADKPEGAKPGVTWAVAMRPGKRNAWDKESPLDSVFEKIEKLKATARAKVAHTFRGIKCQYVNIKAATAAWSITRCKLHTLLALSNLAEY
jgi:transposase, IS5 family